MTAETSPTLSRIRAAGVLRVGTTGDYTPFSLLQADGSYRGADIDMAHDLAARLGVRVAFVPSVWVDLLDHFLAGRFDIAMGGVTVTAPRAERAFFSVPTFVDGKRPLCRREDRERYTSIAAINRPDVRVIANPGSANEAFARTNFSDADITIHHDNASVFLEIVAGRADVMVTDGLEADHQAQLHPELCAAPVAAPFTRLEKAYMFARDPVMKRYIDDWLGAAFASGEWQCALDRAMAHDLP
ncbi:MAG TPA: transporter substrate-binding domain-containing protein [Stellaceae bacterium]|jgi:cyclohexadienyl dehydratase|nr:transporter substrate-binding domain-containing protein [Stellaceae bacterium]